MNQPFSQFFYSTGMYKFTCFLTLIALFFTSCDDTSQAKSDEPFGNCQYGAPKAVFKQSIPKINTHTFKLNKESAVENVAFEGGVNLELVQSGCEKPKQEFQFTIPADTKSFADADWITMGIDLFAFMGNLAPELQPFLMWQGALKDRIGQLKLGLPHELEKGFFVKMDKVAGSDSGLLIVSLYQE